MTCIRADIFASIREPSGDFNVQKNLRATSIVPVFLNSVVMFIPGRMPAVWVRARLRLVAGFKPGCWRLVNDGDRFIRAVRVQ